MAISEATGPEKLIAEAFLQRYGAHAGTELEAFLNDVRQVQLPFELIEQVRRREYPGFAGFESGLPPTYYYFIPGTNYGGYIAPPSNPLERNFVASVDGSGLNFGSLIRLKHALATLLKLPIDEQQEPRQQLSQSCSHLAAVEELIWAGIWVPPVVVTHPSVGVQKSHDWLIKFPEVILNLECKFVPSTWAKTVDGEEFELMRGVFAGKASAQLPNPPPAGTINATAISGIWVVNDDFRRLCWSELTMFPNVAVIIYGSLAGEMTVFSLSVELADQIRKRIVPWPADEFGGFVPIAFHRGEAERRRAARAAQTLPSHTPLPEGLVEVRISSLPPRRLLVRPPEKYPYRYTLVRRLATGEPIFEYVPPFLPAIRGAEDGS